MVIKFFLCQIFPGLKQESLGLDERWNMFRTRKTKNILSCIFVRTNIYHDVRNLFFTWFPSIIGKICRNLKMYVSFIPHWNYFWFIFPVIFSSHLEANEEMKIWVWVWPWALIVTTSDGQDGLCRMQPHFTCCLWLGLTTLNGYNSKLV